MENSPVNTVTFPAANTAAMHVLAGLIYDPLLFSNPDYRFDIADFPSQFQRIIFGAIDHLAHGGMEKISYVDVDAFLKPYTANYLIFCKNDGIGYIQNILKMYDSRKFSYYYDNLKKFSLLSGLVAQGVDVHDVYDADITDPIQGAALQSRFDKMTTDDIVALEEKKIVALREKYAAKNVLSESRMCDGIKELVEEDRQSPKMGLPLTSPKLTTLYRGLRRGAFYLESAGTGVGKSRRMDAEASNLAFPEIYDPKEKKWVKRDWHENVLFISTELKLDEQQRMTLAYLSNVEEDRISLNKCTPEERSRVDKAAQVMSDFGAGMFFVPLALFTVKEVIDIMRKYIQFHGVGYIFFDYLMSNEEMLETGAQKMRISNVREDMLLYGLATELKTLAKTENVMIWSATQLSGDTSQTSLINEMSLRGAKSIADKADDGAVLMEVRDVDRASIAAFFSPTFVKDHSLPLEAVGNPGYVNAVLHFYKMRVGKYSGTKLFTHFDRGTCRWTDCFATDKTGKVLVQVEDTLVEVKANDGAIVPVKEAEGSQLGAILPADVKIPGMINKTPTKASETTNKGTLADSNGVIGGEDW